MGFSEGDAVGFVGSSFRADSVWKSGLMVVDLRTADRSEHDLPP